MISNASFVLSFREIGNLSFFLIFSPQPKPVDNPRPLPPPPKLEGEGLPQRRDSYQDKMDGRSNDSKSSSSSGSKDDNISLGDETPRVIQA